MTTKVYLHTGDPGPDGTANRSLEKRPGELVSRGYPSEFEWDGLFPDSGRHTETISYVSIWQADQFVAAVEMYSAKEVGTRDTLHLTLDLAEYVKELVDGRG